MLLNMSDFTGTGAFNVIRTLAMMLIFLLERNVLFFHIGMVEIFCILNRYCFNTGCPRKSRNLGKKKNQGQCSLATNLLTIQAS